MADPGISWGAPGWAPASYRNGATLRVRALRPASTGHDAAVLRLLCELDPSSTALQHLSENLNEGRARNLEESFGRLSPLEQSTLQQRWGRRWGEFLSLAHEGDASVFAQGLLQIAGSFEDEEKYSEAGGIYSWLVAEGNSPHPPLTLRGGDRLETSFLGEGGEEVPPLRIRGGQEGLPPVAARILDLAQSRLDALQGRGAFGPRVALRLRQITEHATDPAMIAGFGVGSLVAGTVRLGALSRLLGSPTANLLTRGPGASLAASALALGVEVPVVWAGMHGTNILLGRESGFNLDHAGAEMASLALLLGSVRVTGALTQGLFRRIHGVDPLTGEVARLEGFSRISEPLTRQFGMFSGIFLSRLAETRLGWRPGRGVDSLLADSFADLLDFNIGGFVAERALGPGHARFMRELEFRARSVEGPSRDSGEVQEALTPEGFSMPIPGATEGPGGIWDGILMMTAGRRSSHAAVERIRLADALADPALALRFLDTASPTQVQRLTRGLQRQNSTLDLILQMERNAYSIEVQDMLLEVRPLDFSQAAPRLKELEGEFSRFYEARRNAISESQMAENFEAWQRGLSPSDPQALVRLMQAAKRAGIPDIFTGAFDLRRAAINLKARVKANASLARYYYDLSLVREFLQSGGFNQVGKDNNGRRLSELLLNREGNCVTLSLLFAHLAGRLGHELSFGLLPNHLFLVTKAGGVIESTMDFGISVLPAYQRRALPMEREPLDPHQILAIHLVNLGKIFQGEGNERATRESLTLASQILPKNPRPLLELGRYHVAQENYPQALEQFRRVFEMFPQESNGYGKWRVEAWEAAIQGDFSRAERAFKRMNDQNPNDLEVYRGLEWIYTRQGKTQEAEWVRDMSTLME